MTPLHVALCTQEQPACTVCALRPATSEVWWVHQWCGHGSTSHGR